MTDNDIFKAVENYARKNHFIDVEDKLPIFICSVVSDDLFISESL